MRTVALTKTEAPMRELSRRIELRGRAVTEVVVDVLFCRDVGAPRRRAGRTVAERSVSERRARAARIEQHVIACGPRHLHGGVRRHAAVVARAADVAPAITALELDDRQADCGL